MELIMSNDGDKKWGGARPGAGRKPESEDGSTMKMRSIRMSDEEWNKCLELGGSAWIRDRIKRAKLRRTIEPPQKNGTDD